MYYIRRTWAEVNIEAIAKNYSAICNRCHCSVFPVIKADAYGHGAEVIAKRLENQGALGFAVSNIQEAIQLRQSGIQADILILGYTPPECAKLLSEHNISQCVFSLDFANELDAYARKENVVIKTHMKLDTGMGRIGFDFRSDLMKGIVEARAALALKNLDFVGVFTHFAVADSLDASDIAFTRQQYNLFSCAITHLESDGFTFKIKHCNNSAAILGCLGEKENAVRAGIILYGLAPSNEVQIPSGFSPAMALYSVVSMVKQIACGESVSYGRTYTAGQSRKIATVSAGYADGIPRLLSNKGYVLIRGRQAPIVGKICMDQFCIDVTEIGGVTPGDAVTIFGPGLPVDQIAKLAQTINYEIVCGISKRVPRIYINS